MIKSQNIPHLVFAFGALLALTHSYLIGWHNVSVDVGALRYFALRLDWNDLSTFHNGFYPSLSIFLVKIIGPDRWSLFGMLLSNLLLGYSLSISYKIIYHYVSSIPAALVSILFLALSPGFFSVFTSAMPDSIMVALFLSALYLLVCSKRWFLGGLLLGLAASTRYHGLLLAFLSPLLFLSGSKNSLKNLAWCLLGFLLIYWQQMLLSWIATGSTFNNDQLYNVFKTFYRSDIEDAARLQLPDNIFGVIAHKPKLFWAKFGAILWSNSLYFLFPILTVFLLKKNRSHLLRIAALVFFYVLITSLGGSPRMYAPIAVLISVAFAFAYKHFPFRLLRTASVLLLFHFLAIENILDLSVQRQNQRANEEIKTAMLSHNVDVRREAIFSSYYDYTWEGIPGLIGYGTQRAWLRHGDQWFATHFEAPDLNGSAQAFLGYCRRNKIEFVILNKAKLDERLDHGIQHSKNFQLLAQIPNTRPRMTHEYQILSKQFDEVYVFRVVGL